MHEDGLMNDIQKFGLNYKVSPCVIKLFNVIDWIRPMTYRTMYARYLS